MGKHSRIDADAGFSVGLIAAAAGLIIEAAKRQRFDYTSSTFSLAKQLNNQQAIAMAETDTPTELLSLRDKIDQTDSKMIKLLAERFGLTQEVGEIKAKQSLQSFDPTREAQKIQRLRDESAELGLNPDLVASLFTDIMKEVVNNHQRVKQQQAEQQ